jgi:antitoxin component HigA of HigAB toxin-antitoxin module
VAAQARLIAASEEEKWPPRAPSTAAVIRYLMDQHGLKPADLAALFGSAERADDIFCGRRQPTLAMASKRAGRRSPLTVCTLSARKVTIPDR